MIFVNIHTKEGKEGKNFVFVNAGANESTTVQEHLCSEIFKSLDVTLSKLVDDHKIDSYELKPLESQKWA